MPILATDEEAKNDRYWCRTGDEPTGPCFGSERYSSNGPVARLRRPHAGSPKLAAGGRPAPALLLGRWSILRELVDNQMRSIGA